ncbi:MAG: hypothetical protein F4139_01765 [Gemmatimonadetes bacterium]|nr:hypothetical protein [Gemmatimonadota bacterium]MYH51656.1 hypothetical protein [Gemmatimonadota bacterium]MYK67847.1 hypothetical protein [Gemmatimonadota bacterium]
MVASSVRVAAGRLFTFVQVILGISDVLSHEQAQSAFRKDLRAFLADSVAEERLTLTGGTTSAIQRGPMIR